MAKYSFSAPEVAEEIQVANFPPSAWIKWVKPLNDNPAYAEMERKDKGGGNIQWYRHTNTLSGIVTEMNPEGGIPTNYQSSYAKNGEVGFIKVRDITKGDHRGWEYLSTLTLSELYHKIPSMGPQPGDKILIEFTEEIPTSQGNTLKKFKIQVERLEEGTPEIRKECVADLPVAEDPETERKAEAAAKIAEANAVIEEEFVDQDII